jgi:hypothetical protein
MPRAGAANNVNKSAQCPHGYPHSGATYFYASAANSDGNFCPYSNTGTDACPKRIRNYLTAS